MKTNEFRFSTGGDWKEWDVVFAGKLGFLWNREVTGSIYHDENYHKEKIELHGPRPCQATLLLDNEEGVIRCEGFPLDETDYTILVDAFAKKIIVDRKDRVYKHEEPKLPKISLPKSKFNNI